MQMNKPAIRHPRWSSRRAALFKTASSHSRGGLKQSAPATRKTCKSPGVYCDRLVPPSLLYVQTRAAINPAGRAANRSKYFILFRIPRGYYACRGVAWKMLSEWKIGRQRTGRPITRTNGPPSPPPGVNEGSAMHFCVRSTIPATPRPPVLFFPFFIRALLSRR